MEIVDWGLGIEDWGYGIGECEKCSIANRDTAVATPQFQFFNNEKIKFQLLL